MIAPDTRQRNGSPERQQRESSPARTAAAAHSTGPVPPGAVPPGAVPPGAGAAYGFSAAPTMPPEAHAFPESHGFPGAPGIPGAARGAAAVAAVRSAFEGARREYPLAMLVAAGAVVGITAGWLVKRR